MIGHKNLLTACFAALLALGLAACGTTGDDAAPAAMIDDGVTPAMPDPDPDPDPEPVVSACDDGLASETCVGERQLALGGAEEALETLEADEDSTQGQITAAKQAVTDARAALTKAQMARATYQAMQPPTYNNLKAMAGAVDMDMRGMLPAELLINQADPEDDLVRGGKVTAMGYNEATWPPSMIARWVASVWEMENETAKTEDSVVLYTNIEATRPAMYSDYYTVSVPMDVDAPTGFTWLSRPSVVTAGTVADDGVITLGDDVGDGHSLFSATIATMLPIGEGHQINYPDDGVKFDGMFHGVAGTFECTGATCSATNNADGELDTLTGDWTFTPDSTDVMIAGVLTDADFLDFGFWVQTNNFGDSVVYVVDGFFRGEAPRANLTDVVDTAKYKGGAAGLYTKRDFAALEGGGDVTAAGRFTATAEFTANFGDDPKVGTEYQNSISGTISYFMDGGQMIDAAWVVELNRIGGIDGAGEFGVTFTGGTATGAGGTWNGRFFGGVEGGGAPTAPTGVAGEFTAGFGNGDLVGAFGAEKQDD